MGEAGVWWGALIAWLTCVVAVDCLHRRVPNGLVLVGGIVASIALLLDKQPLGAEWSDALVASSLGFTTFLLFYCLGLMGAADVKFAAALGLWIGAWPLLWVWAGASVLAALHALVLIAWRRHTGLPRTRKREIPYAAHMAVTTMGWLIWQHHMS